ncbi:MAG TPA: IclR family transcriptional regulator [Streptosporangiaceae bacterium]
MVAVHDSDWDSAAGGEVADRYTVRSVARAMRLIELVASGPDQGLTLSELARGLGASKSTTLALARTLATAGMLRVRDTRPGPKYNLGTSLIRLGDMARNQLPIGEICRPVIAQLADLTKMTSRVAINDNGYPVFIERVDGPGTVRFYTPLGQREEPHASAAGKAILSTMPADQVRAICAENGLPARTPRTITDLEQLLDSLSTVRANGFAVDDEEDAEGVFCVGAAFFDHDGSCAGAVSVTGIKSDLPTWKIMELGRTVRRSADQVSEQIGGSRYSVWQARSGVLA